MKILWVLVAMASATSTSAQQHRPHQHGVASLEVSAEGNVLELRLKSPLDNLVGFESAPSTSRQHEAIKAMVERFKRPDRLFLPTLAAGCMASAVKLESEVLDPDLLKLASRASRSEVESGTTGPASLRPAHADRAGNSSTEAKHADLEAYVAFTCSTPGAVDGVDVLLFQAFPKLRSIEAAVVTSKGQRGARLSVESSFLRW